MISLWMFCTVFLWYNNMRLQLVVGEKGKLRALIFDKCAQILIQNFLLTCVNSSLQNLKIVSML